MAIWMITPVSTGGKAKLELRYRNLVKNTTEHLGLADADTSIKEIVSWVVNEGKPGDFITMRGMIFQYHSIKKD